MMIHYEAIRSAYLWFWVKHLIWTSKRDLAKLELQILLRERSNRLLACIGLGGYSYAELMMVENPKLVKHYVIMNMGKEAPLYRQAWSRSVIFTYRTVRWAKGVNKALRSWGKE